MGMRYHATGTAGFSASSVTETIDKIMNEIATRAQRDVRLVNVATTPHPAGSAVLVTVIAEDFVKEQ